MLLFAAEWIDGAIRLVTARNVTEAAQWAAQNRDGELPSFIWVLTGAQRRPIYPKDY